ncbi:MAG: ABC transporter ATP-binding protein [Candidatus Omnitrophica bacterium]|nr:ABC transporter ATP-binding protein [Candidatus Omnitrophota bacterium]
MIRIEGLCKSFNSLKVLDGLSLEIKEGETKVIIGRSGCGKSVLLKHIVGIIKPDKGSIFIEDKDITKIKESQLKSVRMKMAMVFQGGALFDSLTVAENVGFVLREHYHFSDKEILEAVKEALSMVELDGVEEFMPVQLSGGMKKRVAIARAICMRPKIILYDEPTTGVDPITADSINTLIRNLHDRLKVTSIVVTHDMKSAYRIADRIAMLYKGRIIAEGTPEEIQNTSDAIVYQFINGLSWGPIKKEDL